MVGVEHDGGGVARAACLVHISGQQSRYDVDKPHAFDVMLHMSPLQNGRSPSRPLQKDARSLTLSTVNGSHPAFVWYTVNRSCAGSSPIHVVTTQDEK